MRPDPQAPRSLRVQQRAFHRLVTSPGGPAAHPVSARLLSVGDAQRSAAARLEVYAEAYFWRLHDVIAEQHPALRRSLGASAFTALVRRYLDALPPHGHDIGEAGARLPLFLASDAETYRRPWLAELAHLERLHLDLFVAADAPPLQLADVRALAPALLPTARLRVVPAFARLECAYDVATLWRAPAPGPAPRRAATRLIVWRKQLAVYHRRVDADEWAALALVARGCPVAELGELLADHLSVAAAARRLGVLLTRWIDDEMLAAGE